MVADHDGLIENPGSRGATPWCLSADFDVLEWDGETVVRVAPTAATHALSPLASAIVSRLRGRSLDLGELVGAVFDEASGEEATESDRAAVQAALTELAALRLVSRSGSA